jgi:acyl carrier protein
MSDQVLTVKAQVRNLVLEAVAPKGLVAIADDECLLKNGAIDSLSMYRIIELLENAFSLVIADHEMVQENFASINKIECFVSTKLAEARSVH